MKKNNPLEKSFGPVGTSAGLLMFALGLVAVYYSFSGLVLVIIGAFVGFTSTSTVIDYDKRRIKLLNNLFGIIKLGHWINIESDMKIGIKKSINSWRAYSRSNRTLDISAKGFIIILYDSHNKQIMPIKKADSLASAKTELEDLSKKLGLATI